MAKLPDSAKTVIIGGGVIGLSIAYHLAKLGAENVILLERNQLTSGTSWHAAGIIGPLRASMNLTKLAVYATELLPLLEDETGQSTGYKQTAGFWLARTEDRMTELKRIADVGVTAGLHPVIMSPHEISEKLGMLEVSDLAGGLWVQEDGQANPVDVCMAYAKGARDGSVRIFEDTGVAAVQTKNGSVCGVETTDGQLISCEKVVNCCGAWARLLGRRNGVSIPLQAVEHMYVVTAPIPGLPQPFPVIRDLEGRIYIKEDAGKLVIGGFEPNGKIWRPDPEGGDAPFLELPENWEQFEPFMEAGLHRIPDLEKTGIQHFMNGPESFTPDTKQLMGEASECRNYFVAAGFNSIGIISSAGVGKIMAEWVSAGACPMDIWDLDIARFEPQHGASAFLDTRVQEAVANQFEMHWPHKQFKTGRGVRRSSFHEAFARQGAVFGSPAGFERPLYFARNEQEKTLQYSYGDQHWWSAVESEISAMTERAALLELSPLSKFLIQGADSASVLQRLCANNIDVTDGKLVYTQMLNACAGIETDLTVTRLDEDKFLIVSGAATRTKDLIWMSRAIGPTENIAITDVTSSHAVLGLMGPKAREILSGLTDADLSPGAFPFATSQEINIGYARIRASRFSFVGELGWELMIPAEFASHVLDQFRQAEVQSMGIFAIDSCRMEKGYKHWGHDIGPADTPLEAGLGFAISWHKPDGFIGRDALLAQKECELERRVMLFEAPAKPLLLHEEPVLRGGKTVGRTTSGARGFRTGKNLCFANVSVSQNDEAEDSYEVIVAGERFPLTPLSNAPYDPNGERMKA